MFVTMNARNQIVEATDIAFGEDYTEVGGTFVENMPNGLLGFNGRVYTPNYMLADGVVAERTAEDKARDPYSDAFVPDGNTETRLTAAETTLQTHDTEIDEIVTGLEALANG